METIKENYFLFGVIGSIFLMFIMVLSFIRRYIKCPPDRIMVVYGKMPEGSEKSHKIIQGGSVFIWPIIQDYAFLDLTPITVKLDIRERQFLQGIKIDVPNEVIVGVSTNPSVADNAAERLLGLIPERIALLAKEIIIGQVKETIKDLGQEQINSNPNLFESTFKIKVSLEINKIGLELLGIT